MYKKKLKICLISSESVNNVYTALYASSYKKFRPPVVMY